MQLIAIALGGALGAVSRYLVQQKVASTITSSVVNGTMVVNIVGSFLMGFVALALLDRVGPEWRGFVAIGFLGSFTTFSTYSADTIRLIESGSYINAALYAGGSVALGLVGFSLGAVVAKGIT